MHYEYLTLNNAFISNKGEKSIILLFEIRFELETCNSSLIIIQLKIKSEIRVRFERNFSVTGEYVKVEGAL